MTMGKPGLSSIICKTFVKKSVHRGRSAAMGMMANVKCVSGHKGSRERKSCRQYSALRNFAICRVSFNRRCYRHRLIQLPLHMKIYPACNGSVIIVDYTRKSGDGGFADESGEELEG